MEMPAVEVVAIMERLSAAGIIAIVDGGWGVDALLGEQTRLHSDLDLVASIAETERVVAALAPLGYRFDVDELPARYTLTRGEPGAADFRQVDVHAVTWDADGSGWQTLPEGPPFRYPPEGLSASGMIAGIAVRCVSPEVQLLAHIGYEPDADDRRDVLALCERFGLAVPDGYAG